MRRFQNHFVNRFQNWFGSVGVRQFSLLTMYLQREKTRARLHNAHKSTQNKKKDEEKQQNLW